MTRALLVALAFAAIASPLACHRAPRAGSCHELADGSVVACVGDEAVTASEVAEFVVEPWWVPGVATLPDARKEALERAIRVHLFAAEAHRRNLALAAGAPSTSIASWSQALVADEAARRKIGREGVSDEEAKAYYESHLQQFHQIDELTVRLVVLDDPKAAEEVYRAAKDANDDAFQALVRDRSKDDASKTSLGERKIVAAKSTDRTLLTLALELRRPGAVGGPVRAADGRWYVMRVLEAPVAKPKPFDETMKMTVKNAIANARRDEALAELARTLRAGAEVVVFDRSLEKIALPAPKS